MKSGIVSEFRGEYSFLSNYYKAPFTWRGLKFPTAEHAFAYGKTLFMDDRHAQMRAQQAIHFNAQSPGEAKKMGRAVKIDLVEWERHKVMYMREIVHAKFMTSEESLVGPLINTGAMMLVEGNDWGDYFWGRCKDKNGVWTGLNTLGAILMEERGWWSRGSLYRPDKVG